MQRRTAIAALLTLVCLLIQHVAATISPAPVVGDQLLRTFLVFAKEPLTVAAASAAGWAAAADYAHTCQPGLGFVYAQGSSSSAGPSASSPAMLLFATDGQISGFGVRAHGLDAFPRIMGAGKFWLPAPGNLSGTYDLFIMLRDPSTVCSTSLMSSHHSSNSSTSIGDRVSINGNFTIPLWRDEALAKHFVPGNCIKEMGSHFWYDLATPGTMTWDAANLLPVLPMYLNSGPQVGRLHAVLIATTHAQRIEPFGQFEGPFTNGFFCKNACKADQAVCSNMKNVGGLWTTMHWEFMDPGLATCVNATCAL